MVGCLYIGIDNGVSGSIGWVYPDGEYGFMRIPVNKGQDYTKKKKMVSRIAFLKTVAVLNGFNLRRYNKDCSLKVILERPMVNSTRFNASVSAVRALESILIAIEWVGLPYQFVDSKQWQKVMLPSGISGTVALKKASLDIGIRMFPNVKDIVTKQKDADGLLMAEWGRRVQL